MGARFLCLKALPICHQTVDCNECLYATCCVQLTLNLILCTQGLELHWLQSLPCHLTSSASVTMHKLTMRRAVDTFTTYFGNHTLALSYIATGILLLLLLHELQKLYRINIILIGVERSGFAPPQLLSSGSIIGLALAGVFICLLIVDLLLLCFRRQGVIATICGKRGKKHNDDEAKLGR